MTFSSGKSRTAMYIAMTQWHREARREYPFCGVYRDQDETQYAANQVVAEFNEALESYGDYLVDEDEEESVFVDDEYLTDILLKLNELDAEADEFSRTVWAHEEGAA